MFDSPPIIAHIGVLREPKQMYNSANAALRKTSSNQQVISLTLESNLSNQKTVLHVGVFFYTQS